MSKFRGLKKSTFLLFLSCTLSAVVAQPLPHRRQAKQILDAADINGGLIVHLGCGDGRLTGALHSGENCLVHGLDTSIENIEKAREHLQSLNLYGPVSIDGYDGKRLPYADNLVNLVVAEDIGRLPLAEVMRVLVPDGTAYMKSDGRWIKKIKPRPEDIDEWSHWLHGPDNNAVSKDKRVGFSRSLQWQMPPNWTRHHNLPAGFNSMVTGGGKIYYMVDSAPNAVYGPGKWLLIARDAFNGLELWRKDIRDWHMKAWGAEKRYGGRIGRFHGAPDYQAPRRIIAAGDRLFVTLGFNAPVTCMDGRTGKVLKVYADTTNAGEIIYRDGILYVARNTYEPEPGKEIMGVDSRTGKALWRNPDYKGIAASIGYQKKHTNAFITAGRKHLFLVDANDIVALDTENGHQSWKKQMSLTNETVGDIDYRYSNFCTLVYHDGTLFFSQIYPGTKNLNRWEMKKLQIEAIDAETGELKWDYTGGTLAHVTPPDLFVNDGKVWTLDPALKANGDCDARLIGLDCQTGEVATTYLLENITHGHHHRCYRNKATEKYYLMGEEGIEYVDFRNGESEVHYWLRGACRYGIMPANGLIYVPPHNCACYLGTLLHGLFALKADSPVTTENEMSDRFRKGPAYDSRLDSAAAAGEADWPMFRRDPARSCSTPVKLPDELSQKWKVSPGGELTPPVIVGENVFLASGDGCQVYCLDAADGGTRWRFAADGPINAPPTYYKGRLFFGTRTGTLYTITADRGKLIWKFRIGPARVYISALGRLESPWPLNGGPLVMDGKVFCAAGRSMSLDSGIYLYKLDAKTGELLQQTNLQTDTEPKGETANNVLADMLVSNGEKIWMKSVQFGANDITSHEFKGKTRRRGVAGEPKEMLRCPTGMLDDSWLNCCFWSYKGCRAQQLVFDEHTAYGISGPSKVGWGGSFSHDVYRPGSGYRLSKWIIDSERTGKRKSKWKNVKVDVRAQSMVLTGNCLVLAGTPDESPRGNPWGAYENRNGASLLLVSRADGKIIAENKLDSKPVYNGMAAANGRLFLAAENGEVVCYGQ